MTYADFVLKTYRDAETRMVEKVAKRLAKGIDEPGWAEKKLAEIRKVRRELEGEAVQLAHISNEMANVLTDAYEAGGKAAAQQLLAGGLLEELQKGAGTSEAFKALVGKATGAIDSLHVAIVRKAEDGYRNVVVSASSQVATGTLTLKEACQVALREFADRGISGFTDAKGREWGMAEYAAMATRTTVHQAHVQGHLDKCYANGKNLVIVSDHMGECEMCRPWEGKVLRIHPEPPQPVQEAIPGPAPAKPTPGPKPANWQEELASMKTWGWLNAFAKKHKIDTSSLTKDQIKNVEWFRAWLQKAMELKNAL